MAYRWRYQDAGGSPAESVAAGAPEDFPDQESAESWLGEHWEELLAAGVHGVTLLDGEIEVYGPMSLHGA